MAMDYQKKRDIAAVLLFIGGSAVIGGTLGLVYGLGIQRGVRLGRESMRPRYFSNR